MLLPATSSAAQSTPTPSASVSATPGWEDQVRAMLARRAAAVLKGDVTTFLETMRDAPDGFRRDRLAWFRRSRALPIGVYRLDFAQDEYGELTRPIDRERHAGHE